MRNRSLPEYLFKRRKVEYIHILIKVSTDDTSQLVYKYVPLKHSRATNDFEQASYVIEVLYKLLSCLEHIIVKYHCDILDSSDNDYST